MSHITEPLISLRPVAPARLRAPKENIPQTKFERDLILSIVREVVRDRNIVPPAPTDDLRALAKEIIARANTKPVYLEYIAVLINNELWREQLATIPFERRLLLLPKCLRLEERCPAPFDEFGLLCKSCGLCSLQDLTEEAEKLGYAVLIAEGSALVMSMIQTGKIEGIVGVSCLSVLERAFPYMEAAAIPGMAIPLLQDDCINTTVDLDWVWDLIHLTSDDRTRRLDLVALRKQIESWFTPEALTEVLGPVDGEVDQLARDMLTQAGKRWRPFLSVAVYQALREDPNAPLPDDIRRLAVGVECFHKASLIHDDIMDGDATRYGEATLHRKYGMPVALTTGDLLIGEGYRLIETCGVSAEQRAAMLRISAEAQRALSLGQGAELLWTQNPKPMTKKEVVAVFRRKTAPAFDACLRLGAAYAGQLEPYDNILRSYSEAIGIAYQIRDDLDDWGEAAESNDLSRHRLSVVLAAAREKAKGEQRATLDAVMSGQTPAGLTERDLEELCSSLGAVENTKLLLESYKDSAIRSLRELDHASLKGLLRRVVGKIFNDLEIKGWCKEVEADRQNSKSETRNPKE